MNEIVKKCTKKKKSLSISKAVKHHHKSPALPPCLTGCNPLSLSQPRPRRKLPQTKFFNLKMCVENSDILDEIVRVANEAADAAGMVVKKYFGNPQLIQSFDKHDKDGCIVEQTTTADLAAEDAMVSVILHNFQDHLVFGKERGWSPEARDADYIWVLDPIDGTTSFKNGVPLFGTLIALLYKSKPIVGIIDQPILQRRWVGVQGRRTTMDGLPVQTRRCQQLSQATLSVCI